MGTTRGITECDEYPHTPTPILSQKIREYLSLYEFLKGEWLCNPWTGPYIKIVI